MVREVDRVGVLADSQRNRTCIGNRRGYFGGWHDHSTVVLNHRGVNRRLEHEKELFTERLAHKRREATRTTAAEAYSKSSDLLRSVNVNTIHKIAAASQLVLPDEVNQSMTAAQQALTLVRALGWTKEVQDSALLLDLELRKFLDQTFALAGVIHSGSSGEAEAMKKYEAQEKAARKALGLYLMEITK